ncbi:MAG: amidohydrolase [Calditrichaeota bacterium]|nr:MAG: amidohydrolase [Calditrichota bacterium]
MSFSGAKRNDFMSAGFPTFDRIQQVVRQMKDELVALRRDFHAYPELSWKEFKTAERVAGELQRVGLEVQEGVCGTAVVAELKGGGKGVLAIRSDMDALPLHDSKDVPYASRVTGALHACGHDSHMAIVIGVAKALQKLGTELPGTVRFIFQPSEETAPSGAGELVKAGVMQDVDHILAFHVDPEIQVGKIGLRKGVLTANCNEFILNVIGKSGHAARPHHAIDTVYLSNQILNLLYDVVSSHAGSLAPAVLTIGKIQGGTKSNVIPEKVEIAGTIRTVDAQTRDDIQNAIAERVHALTRAAGGSYQLEFPEPIPSVVNDAGLVEMARDVAVKMLGQESVVEITKVSMGGEDFSWYLTKAPGALIRLGVRKPDGAITYLHTHEFDIDERALTVGTSLMTAMVLTYFRQATQLPAA